MEGSNGNSNPPAPFLLKTYEMVDNPLTDAIVSWSLSGLSFIVWNPPEFATDLLPKYFKHSNFSSFIRQLNTYGFRKADPELWEFSNEEFVKGHKHLLRNIHRRKPVHSHSSQPTPAPLTDPERDEFLRTIKRLKQEKHSLQSELERHRHDNREYVRQLRALGQALDNINQRQRQLVEGMAGLMRHENPSKRRRLLALSYLRDETQEPSSGLLVDEDLVNKLESSLNFWDELVSKIPVPVHSDLNSFLEDYDTDNSDEHRVGPTCESPLCIVLEPMGKSGSNRTDDGWAISSSAALPAAGAGPGANDVFWQQFLTEVPDVERNSDDDNRKKGDGISGGLADYKHNQLWWVNVDHKPDLQMMRQS